MKNNIKTRGATGLPETTCRRNIRGAMRAIRAMREELTERKAEKKKPRRAVWGREGRGRGD